ncbi:SRPBCC family protein [Streptomyces sp. GTA36]|uniref:SRPBCC family protein n=1 Tax=Streptomyces sp. 2-1 TaxID=412710 RepID=UPI003AFA3645
MLDPRRGIVAEPRLVAVHQIKPVPPVLQPETAPRHHCDPSPNRLEFEDGFADDAGKPNPDMPTMIVRVRLTADGESATLMTVESTFPTAEAMEQLVSMGMAEGMSAGLGQIDALLAEPAT